MCTTKELQLIGMSLLITATVDKKPDNEQCTAVIPYTVQQSVLGEFRKTEKIIALNDQLNISIEQNWADNGVAGVVWDSAVVLARYLLQHSAEVVVGKRVLELGAGTGLPSIAAIIAGALHTIATDVPSSCPLLHRNILANTADADHTAFTVTPLRWGEHSNNDIVQSPFDLILGADLVYDQLVFADLKNTLITYADSSTTILMTSRIRYAKDRKFYANLSDTFRVERVMYDKDTDVHLYHITLLKIN